MTQPILEVNHLKKYFPIEKGILRKHTRNVKAVDDISFQVHKGQTFGLVGESGCGKSTVGRTLVGLYLPTAGEIKFNGRALRKPQDWDRSGTDLQIIFQDPYASLNPRMTVGDIIGEPLEIHRACGRRERDERIRSILRQVGLNPAYMERYPHEFSGGQRQRIGIARALILEPQLIVCDEPISALDVSIQAQVVNLLQDLQKKLNLTYVFIAHDLAMVKYISDRIAVMYLGKIVETSSAEELYRRPNHPYTRALLSSIPEADPKINREKQRVILEGQVPSPIDPPSGCRFRTRCAYAKPVCSETEPLLREIGPDHWSACHFAEQFGQQKDSEVHDFEIDEGEKIQSAAVEG